MVVRSYRELIAWQKSMELVVGVYKVTQLFPSEERFGLTSQLRRAAVSVPSNIAEGHGRASTDEYLRFISIARGSLCEVETQILIAERLDFVSTEDSGVILGAADEVGRILRGLSKSLETK